MENYALDLGRFIQSYYLDNVMYSLNKFSASFCTKKTVSLTVWHCCFPFVQNKSQETKTLDDGMEKGILDKLIFKV